MLGPMCTVTKNHQGIDAGDIENIEENTMDVCVIWQWLLVSVGRAQYTKTNSRINFFSDLWILLELKFNISQTIWYSFVLCPINHFVSRILWFVCYEQASNLHHHLNESETSYQTIVMDGLRDILRGWLSADL